MEEQLQEARKTLVDRVSTLESSMGIHAAHLGYPATNMVATSIPERIAELNHRIALLEQEVFEAKKANGNGSLVDLRSAARVGRSISAGTV